jgi:hypothetical protein
MSEISPQQKKGPKKKKREEQGLKKEVKPHLKSYIFQKREQN